MEQHHQSPPQARRPRQRSRTRLVINPRARAFRKRFFPIASAREWNDWRWQLRHRIKHLDTFV